MTHHPVLTRRQLLSAAAGAAFAGTALPAKAADAPAGAPTDFQIACMTYVYRAFPLQRALEGIAKSGYRYVAWGTEHVETPGRRLPVIAGNAPVSEATELAR